MTEAPQFRPARLSEEDAVLDLIAEGFSYEEGSAAFQPEIGAWHRLLFERLYGLTDAGAPWTVVAERDGQLLSMAGAVPHRFFIDGAPVSGATLTPAATRLPARRQGLAAGCVTKLLDLLRGRGCSFVYLVGHPHYYPRFGFAPVFPIFSTTLDCERVAGLTSTCEVRPLGATDLPAVRSLYTRLSADLPFRGERGDAQWRWQFAWPPVVRPPDWLVAIQEGTIAGYGVVDWDDGAPYVVECFATDDDAYAALLIAAARLSQEAGESTLGIHGPESLPVARVAGRLGGEYEVAAPAAHMLRILDLFAVLSDLRPALSRRAAAAGLVVGSIGVRSAAGDVTIDVKPGSVDVRRGADAAALDLPLTVCAEMIAGYRASNDGRFAPEVSMPDHARDLLAALFPPRAPFLLTRDAFF